MAAPAKIVATVAFVVAFPSLIFGAALAGSPSAGARKVSWVLRVLAAVASLVFSVAAWDGPVKRQAKDGLTED